MIFNLYAPDPLIEQRLQSLEKHLKNENPILIEVVASFRRLDRIAYRLGFLKRDQSYATMIPWWPLVSVLGTFSAGKSTFINHYLGHKLQVSGNQAVDDKFTVICHSKGKQVHVLPGLSLDADPRFPFYQISEDIERVSGGEGKRVDAYLQMKTCPSKSLKGKIIIDSPGFDADEQRTSTLKITEHIIGLSDLVLVFFDARHPEPGAMHDTLEHLVANTIHRTDSNKFLYILNQIDTTAREDNPEEVFGAWQRAIAQKGLTAGRFYTIYNSEASVPIEDAALRERFESKRDADLAEIYERLEQVETERAYRIVGALEKSAAEFGERIVPILTTALEKWRRNTLILDGLFFTTLFALILFLTIQLDYWEGGSFNAPWIDTLANSPLLTGAFALGAAGFIVYIHFWLRKLARGPVIKWLKKEAKSADEAAHFVGAFMRSSAVWRSLFSKLPAGWGRGAKKEVARLINDTDRFVQQLNDRFASPSGDVSKENVPVSQSETSVTKPI
ncbi:MAG: dynamin family protein [Gammaproteobacteria bacterium]|nr:dynamin family protein [Gammaproteobacteria bacterium]